MPLCRSAALPAACRSAALPLSRSAGRMPLCRFAALPLCRSAAARPRHNEFILIKAAAIQKMSEVLFLVKLYTIRKSKSN